MIIMKSEMTTVVRETEKLGDKVYNMAKIAPGILENSIDLSRAVINVPWQAATGSLKYTAEKVDDATGMII